MSQSPVVIVQARMTSTRLPGKVLLPILDRPMLAWELDRLRSVRRDVRIAVATTVRPEDEPIVELCAAMDVPIARGSEEDVLDRYRQAAELFDADPVIRVTSDCPLIDPDVTRAVLELWERSGADYASNTLERRFPRGLDSEVFSRSSLEVAWREAAEAHEREHVTPFLYQHPERFRLRSLRSAEDNGHRRWTVDTEEDLAFVRAVFESLASDRRDFRTADVLELLIERPELELINRMVEQKPLR
jgi:spore coat polysaccharide biosynthesis protein SpsF